MIKLVQLAFEVLLIGGICFVVYSQILRPLVRKTLVFPWFRRRPNYEREMEATNEALGEKAQQRELERAKRKLGS